MTRNRESEGRRAPLTGRQFGPYILQDLLGAGGMGEVYRARDTRLNRAVAIKVLSVDLASNPERLARLAREARLLASLNHPHIGAIYELEDADGVSGLVLELIEGLTLADRLRSGALPQDVAFSIAEQIVDALAAAHAAGIVHRDLKPANIKITPQGTVKILDFGLAKALDSTTQVDEEASTEYSLGATRAGSVLGTPAYMSPEQARGEPVDQRTDIWAFGVVLFEMLTGRRPFAGRTTTDTLAGVLKEDPDWGSVPIAAHRLLRACLDKDPTRRLQAISDARLLLDDAPGPRPARASAARWLWPVLSLVSLSLAAGLVLERSRQPMPDSPVVKFQVPAPRGVSLDAPIVSPDGRSIVYFGPPRGTPGVASLWLHSLETGQDRVLFQPQRMTAGTPFWSPDSRWVAFAADFRLFKIEVATAALHSLADLQPLSSGGFLAAGGTWNSDDVILFSTGPIVRISANGGTPEPVTIVDRARKEIGHSLPVFLPDGRHFLYLRASPSTEGSGIYVGSLETRPEAQDARRVVGTRAGALYVPGGDAGPGRLLFLRGSSVFAQPFDAAALKLEGEAVPVLERVGFNGGPATRYGLVSASPAGVLAYREPESVYATPVWVDRGGRELGALVPEPLDSPADLRLSPDGRRLALTREGNVWIYDLAGRPPVKLTTDGLADMLLWTPDGARVVFEHGGPPQRLLSVAADAAGEAPQVVSPPGHYHAHGWSPDKRHLIAVINTYSPTGWDIVTLPVGREAPPQPVLQTRFNEGFVGASLSPDGRWLAYPSNATGALEIWVQPYPGPGTPRRISPNGGTDPAWSKDGRELFYLEGRNMMAVGVKTGSTLDFAKPVQLFASPYMHQRFTPLSYDVAADGRFIMLKQANTMSTPTPFTVVLNWRAARH